MALVPDIRKQVEMGIERGSSVSAQTHDIDGGTAPNGDVRTPGGKKHTWTHTQRERKRVNGGWGEEGRRGKDTTEYPCPRTRYGGVSTNAQTALTSVM